MKRGSFFYQFYNPGLLAQPLLQRKTTLEGSPLVFFDASFFFIIHSFFLSIKERGIA
jgi:hypothetical protein